jgi:hypothetical protein
VIANRFCSKRIYFSGSNPLGTTRFPQEHKWKYKRNLEEGKTITSESESAFWLAHCTINPPPVILLVATTRSSTNAFEVVQEAPKNAQPSWIRTNGCIKLAAVACGCCAVLSASCSRIFIGATWTVKCSTCRTMHLPAMSLLARQTEVCPSVGCIN